MRDWLFGIFAAIFYAVTGFMDWLVAEHPILAVLLFFTVIALLIKLAITIVAGGIALVIALPVLAVRAVGALLAGLWHLLGDTLPYARGQVTLSALGAAAAWVAVAVTGTEPWPAALATAALAAGVAWRVRAHKTKEAASAAKHAELEAAMDALHSAVEVTPANCRHTAEMERVRQRYVELGYEPWLAAKMASRYGTDLQAEEDAAQGA